MNQSCTYKQGDLANTILQISWKLLTSSQKRLCCNILFRDEIFRGALREPRNVYVTSVPRLKAITYAQPTLPQLVSMLSTSNEILKSPGNRKLGDEEAGKIVNEECQYPYVAILHTHAPTPQNPRADKAATPRFQETHKKTISHSALQSFQAERERKKRRV
ncbi:hypothetical protein K458DRAFT_70670 [Lentithecium fluviatile CBS 122367]|uniref:Uncharacterized protein n=1 Tax=Lentithecium fluviatile CBS 122367 TaxID=1168545 RepID=A0A6G1JM84_9PLEO|nr:hypothetical protein K458DRAFT_70670 [Lentithecium fluviatile CBS 122367]